MKKSEQTYVCRTCGATARGVGIECSPCSDLTLARYVLETPEEQAEKTRETKSAYRWARSVVAASENRSV
jgi:predicted ATP-dependent serine protease